MYRSNKETLLSTQKETNEEKIQKPQRSQQKKEEIGEFIIGDRESNDHVTNKPNYLTYLNQVGKKKHVRNGTCKMEREK